MTEKALSVHLVTLVGRRRMRPVLCGTVLDHKAVALHTTLGAGEARRLTRYTIITLNSQLDNVLYKMPLMFDIEASHCIWCLKSNVSPTPHFQGSVKGSDSWMNPMTRQFSNMGLMVCIA